MKSLFRAVILIILLALAGTGFAQPVDCEDEVYAVVDGGTVTVFHDGAVYNCCPDPFEYTVEVAGDQILVVETEVLSNPCFCICCFDLFVEIEDVAPGDYTLTFTWYDYETMEWLDWILPVSVPDAGQGSEARVAATYLSDCYADPTGVPGDDGPGNQPPLKPGSWGDVKALFR